MTRDEAWQQAKVVLRDAARFTGWNESLLDDPLSQSYRLCSAVADLILATHNAALEMAASDCDLMAVTALQMHKKHPDDGNLMAYGAATRLAAEHRKNKVEVK